MNQLPDKLWELIDVAVADLRKIEADPRYIIKMYTSWHSARHDETCAVCFAGAVIAKTLGADITKTLAPSNFEASIWRKLHSLNNVRMGEITKAKEILYGDKRGSEGEYVYVPMYAENPDGFYKVMEKIKNKLKEEDL